MIVYHLLKYQLYAMILSIVFSHRAELDFTSVISDDSYLSLSDDLFKNARLYAQIEQISVSLTTARSHTEQR